jgi:hypothetical protein
MFSVRRLAGTRLYCTLVAVSILLPPAYCYGQFCYASSTTEALSNQSLTWQPLMNMYTYNYTVIVNWNCTTGSFLYCTVCELDTVYIANASGYAFYDSIGTSDSASACGTLNNQNVWNGFFTLPPSSNFEIVCAYKEATNSSPCNTPQGYWTGATNYFASGNGSGS